MSTLSTQVLTRGTQILEYSMQYCLKYLDLEYFLAVKGLGSPKFPCMSQLDKQEHVTVMLKLKFIRNRMTLNITYNMQETVIFDPKEMIEFQIYDHWDITRLGKVFYSKM